MIQFPPQLESRAVDEVTIQRLFNEGKYQQKIKELKGLFAVHERCGPVSPNDERIHPVKLPVGSISHTIRFKDATTRETIIFLHRFIKPDGHIGWSGKNDPKMLLIKNVKFYKAKPAEITVQTTNREINDLLDKRFPFNLVTYFNGWWVRSKTRSTIRTWLGDPPHPKPPLAP